MPKHATTFIRTSEAERERQLNDLAPPEEMERRREFLAWFRAQMDKPATEEDLKIWREFAADLEKDRSNFHW
ncbi:MAG: hypothetical protein DMF53_02150 [Acidobacteria bacterium]|nr:MAG: hypothetical protein DMF53_02150 [Acidobacteriota bacterium]